MSASRRVLSSCLTTLLAALLAAAWPGAAAAELGDGDEPRPLELHVAGGSGWRPDNSFRLDWSRTALGSMRFPTTAAVYVLRGADGEPVEPPRRLVGAVDTITHVRVPQPGAFRVEVRLESGATVGPPAFAWLRFDPAAPPPPSVRAAAPWFGAGRPALLEFGRPAGELPLSRLRGYAVAVGRDRVPAPCPSGRCAEVRVASAGEGGEVADLGLLGEGESVAAVVAVSGAGLASAPVEVPLRVDTGPPAVRLAGVPAGWASGPVRVVALASDGLSGMAAAGPGGPATGISVDGAPPSTVPGPEATALVAGEGAHTVAAQARDAAGNRSVRADPAARAVVRIDRTPPTVAFAPPAAADPERIVATVADPLSGPDPRRGWIGVRPARSNVAFEPLPTALEAGRLVARWDSDRAAPGSYELRAVAFDRAGNRAVSGRRSDGAAMVLAAPLRRAAELQLGFGGRRLVWHRCGRAGERRRCRREVLAAFEARPAARLLPHGRAVAVAGLLRGPGGEPLAGREVEVVETFAAGAAEPVRVTTALTGPDGFFGARLAPGPGRRIEARFGGSRVYSRAAAGPLRVAVRSGLRLRVSAAVARIGGRPVVFSGRLLGAAARPGGRAVQLQFRLAGLPWREFRTVRTDAAGRFRYRYTFADDDSRGARFQFRAYVPTQPGWPYQAAASRPVFVTGS